MSNQDLKVRLGFTNLQPTNLISNNSAYSAFADTEIYIYEASKESKTTFYWINAKSLKEDDKKKIRARIWNENRVDLVLWEYEKRLDVNYAGTPPNKPLIEIVSIPTSVEDSVLLESINKKHFDTGTLWLKYGEALDKIKNKKQLVDNALVDRLKCLRTRLNLIYSDIISDTRDRCKIVQALIDRTLFIKFLEDKFIINSSFYASYFNDGNLRYVDLLASDSNVGSVNKLFWLIDEIFNNNLFRTPHIQESELPVEALLEIRNAIKATTEYGQLSLFDFQFDVIPVEFISHIYQIFLDDEKSEKGIFYTPKGLAKLVLDNTIPDKTQGPVLDPSCGSGMFLVLAFRKMYANVKQKQDLHQEIIQRLTFIKKYIFGIEIEFTARRLAIFSLYLETLRDIDPVKLSNVIIGIINSKNKKTLFPKELDFNDNIFCGNALEIGKNSPFLEKTFDFIIGNPPWFKIKNKSVNDENEQINYTYYTTYSQFFSDEQISQCFLHKIKDWGHSNTKFGFIVNSSNFQCDSQKFENFIFSNYSLKNFYELSKIKKILFKYASEPACVIIFQTKSEKENDVVYIAPSLNSFAEIFEIIILKKQDFVSIPIRKLRDRTARFRDFLYGDNSDLKLIKKLSTNTYIRLEVLILKNNNGVPYIHEGMKLVGEKSICDKYGIKNALWKSYTEEKKSSLREQFKREISSVNQNNDFIVPYISPSNIEEYYINGQERFMPDTLPNCERPRNPDIYVGEKILWNRTGSTLKAAFCNYKLYYDFDIHVIKLENPSLYPIITAILNSNLVKYYSKIMLRKREGGSYPKINNADLLSLPIPFSFDARIVGLIENAIGDLKHNQPSSTKELLNKLVYELYELTPIEQQRITDFLINGKQELSDMILDRYCRVFYQTIRLQLRAKVCFSYFYNTNIPLNLVGVKVTFLSDSLDTNKVNIPTFPNISKITISFNEDLLKDIGNDVVISFTDRVYSNDSVYILKDKDIKNWTETAAYDDAINELEKILKV